MDEYNWHKHMSKIISKSSFSFYLFVKIENTHWPPRYSQRRAPSLHQPCLSSDESNRPSYPGFAEIRRRENYSYPSLGLFSFPAFKQHEFLRSQHQHGETFIIHRIDEATRKVSYPLQKTTGDFDRNNGAITHMSINQCTKLWSRTSLFFS